MKFPEFTKVKSKQFTLSFQEDKLVVDLEKRPRLDITSSLELRLFLDQAVTSGQSLRLIESISTFLKCKGAQFLKCSNSEA